jgi:zinc transporter 1
MNLRGVLLHVAGDALGSIAVIVSALIIWFSNGDWKFYSDPVCSLIIVAIIVSGTIPLVKESCRILLQNCPVYFDTGEIKELILREREVLEVHCLHVWTMSGRNHVASMHVVLKKGTDFMSVSDNIKHMLHQYGIHANTIQPEFVSSTKVRSPIHFSDFPDDSVTIFHRSFERI